MAHAARMTDTGDMELLEREPSLALLADYAAETVDHHVSAVLAKLGAPNRNAAAARAAKLGLIS